MAWIQSHQELARHPKTRRLARALGVSIPCAVGHLHMLWWYALDFAEDGDLTAHAQEDIADACMWDGDPGILWHGLITTGFVDCDEDEDGNEISVIHDWYEYAGKLIERRKTDAERKKSARHPAPSETTPTPANGQITDVQRTSNGHPTDGGRKSRVEKRRVDQVKATVVDPPSDTEQRLLRLLRSLPRWVPTKNNDDLIKLRAWVALYPGLNFPVELDTMDSWLRKNSTRKPSYPFVSNWLKRTYGDGTKYAAAQERDSGSGTEFGPDYIDFNAEFAERDRLHALERAEPLTDHGGGAELETPANRPTVGSTA